MKQILGTCLLCDWKMIFSLVNHVFILDLENGLLLGPLPAPEQMEVQTKASEQSEDDAEVDLGSNGTDLKGKV